MDQDAAQVWDVKRWRWSDRRTVVALVAGVLAGAGAGIVAGAAAGSEIVPVGLAPYMSIEIVHRFDPLRASQVGVVTALLVGLAAIATLRLGFLEVVDRRDWTRRRALIVGVIAVVGMVGAWVLLGLKFVKIAYTTSHPVPQFPSDAVAFAPPLSASFYVFDAVPALIGMVAIFVAVAFLGSVFRRPPQGM